MERARPYAHLRKEGKMVCSICGEFSSAVTCHACNRPCPSCSAKNTELAGLKERVRELEDMYPNWRGKFASLADAVRWHADSQDTLIKTLRGDIEGANALISSIEELFPNWRNYRDLTECIRAVLEGKP